MKLLLLTVTLISCLEQRALYFIGVREENGNNSGFYIEQLQKECGLFKGAAYCGCYLYVKHNACDAAYPLNYSWAPNWGRADKIVWRRGDPPDAIQDGMTVLLHNGERVFHVGSVFKKSQDNNGWYIIYDSGNSRSTNIISGEGIHLSKLYLRQIYAIADWITPKGETPVKYHVVQSQQNLFRLSLKYKVTVDELRKWNGLKENEAIFIGQKLRVG